MTRIIYSILLVATGGCLLAQNVGIGTNAPAEKLDVAGNIKMSGEIKPNGIAGQPGAVLTSNGNGTMQWALGNSEASVNGGWGDCSIYNIDAFYPVGNTNAQNGDNFGRSVSISGDYAIVGTPYDNEGFALNGSATIFKYNSTTGVWEEQVKLVNPNAGASDFFGWSVSISGDYAIVGAYHDTESGQSSTGSATVFKRNINTGVWESQGKLLNPSAGSNDSFGWSVSISGDYAIVGAYQDDESGLFDCGSATVFKRNVNTGVWESQGKLLNPNPMGFDQFGYSVSISGNYAIIGASEDDENGYFDNGSATIFKRNTGTGVWESQGKLTDDSGNHDDYFGFSVAISGDYAVVGAPFDDEVFTNNGSATIYKRNTGSGVWENQGKLTNANAQDNDQFGGYVSISNGYVMIGASVDDENGAVDNGSVTIFKKISEGVWYAHQKFSCPYPANGTFFGPVCLSATDNRFIVGAKGMVYGKGLALFGKIK